jgi:hypothetical protein
MSNEDETRKQVEEDAKEDLELEDEDADKVGGQRKAGKGQQEYMVVKMNDVIISSPPITE